MFTQPAPPTAVNEELFMFIDPAAGGPQSDYAVLTVARRKGIITVRKICWLITSADRPLGCCRSAREGSCPRS